MFSSKFHGFEWRFFHIGLSAKDHISLIADFIVWFGPLFAWNIFFHFQRRCAIYKKNILFYLLFFKVVCVSLVSFSDAIWIFKI